MRYRIAAFAVCFAALAFVRSAHALDPPALVAHVNDLAGVLTAGERQALEAKLTSYEQRTGHQFAVLIIPSLEGDPIEDFGIRVAERWKLGDAGRDDGLILLVAMKERQMRIEVGYGLEGAIPDAIAARVRRDIITPQFQAGRVAAGIDAGMDALMKAGQGESIGAPPSTVQRRGGRGGPSFMFVFFALLFVSVVTRRLPGIVRAPVSAALGAGLGLLVFQSLIFAAAGGFLGFVFGLVSHRTGWFGMGGFPGGLGGGGFGGFGGGGGGGGGWGGGGGGFGGGGSSGSW